MSQNVEEADLDFHYFRCCGDEDLYPFGCPRCGRLMVFCYFSTLHSDDLALCLAGGFVSILWFEALKMFKKKWWA